MPTLIALSSGSNSELCNGAHPFLPETIKTDEGKFQLDRTLVIKNLNFKNHEKFLDKATPWTKEYYSDEFCKKWKYN